MKFGSNILITTLLVYVVLWQIHLSNNVLGIPGIQQLKMDGDIILGGLFPVHRKSKVTENACGEIDPQPGFQYLVAMLFALQQINNSTRLLPNITLGAEIYDTCRSQTIGADRAKDIIKYTLLDNTQPLVGVIGPFTSDVSIAVANLLRVFEIPQISYGSSSAELSNKELYGNFFRTVPPDTFQAQALVDVIRHYGWTYVYTINSNDNYGKKGMKLFHKIARKAGICIAKAASLPSLPTETNYKSALQTVTRHKLGNSHVIVLYTSQADSAGLLRAAKESGINDLTWLGSSGWSNRVDVTEGKEEIASGSLTVGHHEGIVNGFLDFLTNLDRNLGGTMIGNLRNTWFEEALKSVLKCTTASPRSPSVRVCKSNASIPRDIELAPIRVVVNAVYAMAQALSDMQRELCPEQTGICERMKNTLKATSLISYLKNVTFSDAAFISSVKFNENQEIDGDYSIMNFQQRKHGEWKYVHVGYWRSLRNSSEEKISELNINDSLVSWGNARKRPPRSYCSEPCSLKQIQKHKTVNPKCCWDCKHCGSNEVIVNNTCRACNVGYKPDASLARCLKLDLSFPEWTDPMSASLGVGTGVWVFVAIGTFVFYVINRNHNVIKAAGKELSFIIFIGIILCFVSSLISLAKPTDIVCILRRYIGSTCFTMCYAPLLMKTNRIYRIFTHARHSAARPSLIKPMSQVLISMGLVAVQLIITTVWTLSDPPKAIVEYPSLEKASLVCTVSIVSLAVNMCYNLLLMFLCTVFAFKTRSFPRNFNEAKHIGITMYITCSFWIIFMPTYFNIKTSAWKDYMYCSLFVLAGSVNLVGLLLPKVAIIILTKASTETVHVSDESYGERNESNMAYSSRLNKVVDLDSALSKVKAQASIANQPEAGSSKSTDSIRN
ncbi:hypothetical protein OS493_001992 [Desmophyllum pertusum]|uniref:G-protein coupled receptors family 3 profile domain-containing protein n=1 Tax=Desmophyllum pertusum TaxID=174260 RepID=A0A9W9Z571_9CNID|nr:hypothetical protein OS493_001992 [Desmophyllum pertusum]